eukprot:4489909-Prymnesium_polylepis.1
MSTLNYTRAPPEPAGHAAIHNKNSTDLSLARRPNAQAQSAPSSKLSLGRRPKLKSVEVAPFVSVGFTQYHLELTHAQ